MKSKIDKLRRYYKADQEIFMLIAAIFIILLMFGTYSQIQLRVKIANQKQGFETQIEELNTQIGELDSELLISKEENSELSLLLSDEERKVYELEREDRRKEREIEDLTKLTKIDPELLKKYSKVYFLSENYEPRDLDSIDEHYASDKSRDYRFLEEAMPFLEEMLDDAERDDIIIKVASAYRSFDYQKDLKSRYVVTYGATTANSFSAEQGYSEHQLGTTVDFTTPGLGGALSGFHNIEAYQWLLENAWKYGFVLSYPEDNAHYIYEPWHWRFVGKELAKDLHRDEEYFYELDQREIDKYLPDIFEE